jgi:hypothetical protein
VCVCVCVCVGAVKVVLLLMGGAFHITWLSVCMCVCVHWRCEGGAPTDGGGVSHHMAQRVCVCVCRPQVFKYSSEEHCMWQTTKGSHCMWQTTKGSHCMWQTTRFTMHVANYKMASSTTLLIQSLQSSADTISRCPLIMLAVLSLPAEAFLFFTRLTS